MEATHDARRRVVNMFMGTSLGAALLSIFYPIIRYLRPLDDILPHLEPHRAYLRGLEAQGLLLASGPFEPRSGGALLLRLPDGDPDAGARVRKNDPFTRLGLASYELLPWRPVLGLDRLDAL